MASVELSASSNMSLNERVNNGAMLVSSILLAPVKGTKDVNASRNSGTCFFQMRTVTANPKQQAKTQGMINIYSPIESLQPVDLGADVRNRKQKERSRHN